MIKSVEELEAVKKNLEKLGEIQFASKICMDMEKHLRDIKNLDELIKYARRIEELEEANKWHDVNEVLPKNGSYVLVDTVDKIYSACYYLNKKFRLSGDNVHVTHITHWKHINKPEDK